MLASDGMRSHGSRALAVLLLALVFAVLWFGALDYRKLTKPDEGRYAEIPREMAASGDWLTPRLNGFKYFEKPPLQYWATATAYTAFGEAHWTARLWSALTGFLGVLVAWAAMRRLAGAYAALATASVLASGALYVAIGQMNTLDMGLTFFLAGAVFALSVAQDGRSTSVSRRWLMWAAWASLALAVLSKGLVGLVLPAATVLMYSLWQRDFGIWRRLHLVSGLIIFLAIAAPWFIAVSIANPEFFSFFFIQEHFQRFLTEMHGRYEPPWYFIPILMVGLMPWTSSAFAAVFSPSLWRAGQRQAGSFSPRRFLLVWGLVVFGFFSLSDSKLPSYILPLFPAVAALIGWHCAEMAATTPRHLRWHALMLVPLAIAGLAATPLAMRFASEKVPPALYAQYLPWLYGAAGVLLALALAAYIFASRAKPLAALLSLAAAGFLCAQMIVLGHESLSPSHSAYLVARQLRPLIAPDAPFFIVDTYDQTLPFYLQRTVTMVRYQSELSHAIRHEPHKFVPDLESFARRWQSEPVAWALMTPQVYRDFAAQELPMQLVIRDTKRIIVRKPSTMREVITP